MIRLSPSVFRLSPAAVVPVSSGSGRRRQVKRKAKKDLQSRGEVLVARGERDGATERDGGRSEGTEEERRRKKNKGNRERGDCQRE